MSYTLTAVLCPLPSLQTTAINPANLTPTQSPTLALGDTTALLAKFNELSARLDAAGRATAAYAVTNGLAISAASGLNLTVASGQCMMDSIVTVPTNLTVALPDDTARVYIWISQGGTATYQTTTASPGATWIFVGSAVTAAGLISSVDMSGVMKLCGSSLCRFTSDQSTPLDSPGALTFLTIGASGIWLWDGAAYHCLQGGAAALTFSSDANKTLTASQYENACLLFGSGGTVLTATRNVVLPLQAGRQWTCKNGSPGAQSLQFIGASGTGIAVATGKTAIITNDGVNFLRVTADNP